LYIVWGWHWQINVAMVDNEKINGISKLKIETISSYDIKLECDWTSDPAEIEVAFCDSVQYFALHKGKLLLSVDTQGWKSASSFMHILDMISGEILWKFSGSWYMSPPTVYNDILYFAGSGQIAALDLQNFKQIWRTGYCHEADDDHRAGGLVIVAPCGHLFVYFDYHGSHLWCLDLLTGTTNWKIKEPTSGYYKLDGVEIDETVPPNCQFVHNNKIYLVGPKETLVVHEAQLI